METAQPAGTAEIVDHIRTVMMPGAWLTATQVQQRLRQWDVSAVRHTLRAMAEGGEIETRLSRFLDGAVREYRTRG